MTLMKTRLILTVLVVAGLLLTACNGSGSLSLDGGLEVGDGGDGGSGGGSVSQSTLLIILVVVLLVVALVAILR